MEGTVRSLGRVIQGGTGEKTTQGRHEKIYGFHQAPGARKWKHVVNDKR